MHVRRDGIVCSNLSSQHYMFTFVAETVRVWQGNHRGGIEFDPIINWDVNMDIVSMQLCAMEFTTFL